MSKHPKPSRRRIREKTHAIRQAISAMDFAASGTLHSRTKACGKPACTCATDPDARHGPYVEWTRRTDGRLQHRVVSPDQARLLERAIANYREIRRLLARWEAETAAEILPHAEPSPGRSRR